MIPLSRWRMMPSVVEWPGKKPAIVLAIAGEARRAAMARKVCDLEVLEADSMQRATAWIRDRDGAVGALVVDVELSDDSGTLVVVGGKTYDVPAMVALAQDVGSRAARDAACLGARVHAREDSILALRELVVPWRMKAHVPAQIVGRGR